MGTEMQTPPKHYCRGSLKMGPGRPRQGGWERWDPVSYVKYGPFEQRWGGGNLRAQVSNKCWMRRSKARKAQE